MKSWIDSRWFQRTLEIIPGTTVWLALIFPFVFAFFLPVAVAYFILIFNLYWFLKAFNLARHLINGLYHLKHHMKIDWYERAKMASADIKKYQEFLVKENGKNPNRYLKKEIKEISNLEGREDLVKKLNDIIHLVIIATFKEDPEILDTTIQHLSESNYPNEKIMVVLAGEERDEKFPKIVREFEEKYGNVFLDFLSYAHKDTLGEVKGKGSGITYAGRKVAKVLKDKKYDPENVLVTNLDADHIVHHEYFSRLTYKYIIDPDRDRKTYQPVALLFNNIWDAPAPNRVAATGASFWVIFESMRPYRLKTFAAHTQSLKTLIVTDFWSTQTIVEDGHQFFRTYFAFNGNIEMVPLYVPVYQDCVLDRTIWRTFKSQYLQRRRWAWGVSDFPFVVKNFLKHPEIPKTEKFIQTYRQFIAHFSQGSSSLLLATAWIPLLFNERFMDSVLAHNVTRYGSDLLNVAWFGIFFSVWTYFSLLPKKPERHSKFRYIGMFVQWIFTPPVAIALSSLPSIDAQTRLMFGKYLDFFVTPKVRKSDIILKNPEKETS